jgi:hypothetical protein
MGETKKRDQRGEPPRKGPGRPPKDPAELFDDELQVPCKKEDKLRWRVKAASADLSLAAWVRAKLG